MHSRTDQLHRFGTHSRPTQAPRTALVENITMFHSAATNPRRAAR